MEQRSFIIHQRTGKQQPHYKGIYCHRNGHPSDNGSMLFNHYSNSRRLAQLIALGDICFLQPLVAQDPSGRPHTIAYHRDCDGRGSPTASSETDHLPKLMQIAQESGCEYVYLFDGEYWSVSERNRETFGTGNCEPFTAFVPLDDVLTQIDYRQMAR